MADRGSFGGQRAPMGGGRFDRGSGSDRFGESWDFPQRHQYQSFGQGEFRGRRNPYPQWRPRGLGRGNTQQQTEDSQFDLGENLNQNRRNTSGGETIPDGSKKTDETPLKDTAQSDNNKQGASHDQLNQAEKDDTLKKSDDKRGTLLTNACGRCGKF